MIITTHQQQCYCGSIKGPATLWGFPRTFSFGLVIIMQKFWGTTTHRPGCFMFLSAWGECLLHHPWLCTMKQPNPLPVPKNCKLFWDRIPIVFTYKSCGLNSSCFPHFSTHFQPKQCILNGETYWVALSHGIMIGKLATPTGLQQQWSTTPWLAATGSW